MATKDRTAELMAIAKVMPVEKEKEKEKEEEGKEKREGAHVLEMRLYRELKEVELLLAQVARETEHLRGLDTNQFGERRKQLEGQLASSLAAVQALCMEAKRELAVLKGPCQDYLILATEHSKLCQGFASAARVFHEEYGKVRERLLGHRRRQLENLASHVLTEAEIDRVLLSGKDEEILETAHLESYIGSDALEVVLADMDARHLAILELERDIKEVQGLFLDLACLVEEQGEKLQVIALNIQKTATHVKKAEVEIKQSEKQQKCGRKMMCCIFCFFALVAIITLAATGAFSGGSA